MNISDLLAPEAVLASLKAQNKKQLLQELAARAHARTGLPEKQIFETLIERERLGTTGVGSGIAIPHGRMAGATSITGVFARLESPIAYDAVDELNWPRGTMPFSAYKPDLLKGITVGQHVRFKLDSQQITELTPY